MQLLFTLPKHHPLPHATHFSFLFLAFFVCQQRQCYINTQSNDKSTLFIHLLLSETVIVNSFGQIVRRQLYGYNLVAWF